MATVEPTPTLRRRSSELGLLVLSLGLGGVAYALVGLTRSGHLPVTFYRDFSILVAITLITHLVVRRKAAYADPVILPVAVALNGIGLAMLYQLEPNTNVPGTDGMAIKQALLTVVSMAIACVVLLLLRDHRTLRRYTYVALLATAILLILPLLPGLGTELNGARIWIHVGPLSFQPAELAKIAFAIFCAGYLVTNRDTLALAGRKVWGLQLPRIRDFGPLLIALGISLAVLVFQRDLGTSLLFLGIFVGMLYIATERFSWILIGFMLFLVGAYGAYKSFSHVERRFDGWLHAFDDSVYNAAGGSAQLVDGLFGMANGGLLGSGWGRGYPHLTPYAFSDFIIAGLGEVLGLTGLFAILALYAILIQRGFRTAISTRDGFGKLLAGGLAFALAWQCFVVIGGVTRVIPITGLTAPFLAYGGSSLLANWLIVALLIRISDNARRPHPLPLRGTAKSDAGVSA
ncbi:FtsW/RodA/SpoVE family cell cycle protein [Rarobacter faecitabidus]|uniref:Cell elongation-specific peptidoglycan biosynthesis regulator RodA n=1 Tax=Rarobacter faecitabidus TaxID=13243 RepID=A0A542ZP83_RARFA|nr:FtsW/RodA/SpoVE family cell cycle protein [Rarobacter faecitabidus]TQL62181.1 cell elongation-specific peptidoglycan biosynthesis regulator RodA [Rarobacter faecitabidus]